MSGGIDIERVLVAAVEFRAADDRWLYFVASFLGSDELTPEERVLHDTERARWNRAVSALLTACRAEWVAPLAEEEGAP